MKETEESRTETSSGVCGGVHQCLFLLVVNTEIKKKNDPCGEQMVLGTLRDLPLGLQNLNSCH